jgi:hypothetical protein
MPLETEEDNVALVKHLSPNWSMNILTFLVVENICI